MSKSPKEDALNLVILRNIFYKDGYKRVLFAVLLLLVMDVMLGYYIVYKYFSPPKPQYFAATASGRILKSYSLVDPVLSDQQVLQWTSVAVRRIYQIDFVHWHNQLQIASNYFTSAGWRYFSDALTKSNNLNTIKSLKMVSSISITGSPKIIEKDIISGRYAWKVEVPVQVLYQNNSSPSIRQQFGITLIVVRVPVVNNPDRIAINNFIPTVSET